MSILEYIFKKALPELNDTSQEYYKAIDVLFECDDTSIHTNQKIESQAAAYRLFFNKAKHHVYIYVDVLRPVIFNDIQLVMAAKQALHRGVFIVVITNLPTGSDFEHINHHLYKVFEVEPKDSMIAKDFCFATMDDRAYRCHHNSLAKSNLCLNDDKTVSILNCSFNNILTNNHFSLA